MTLLFTLYAERQLYANVLHMLRDRKNTDAGKSRG